MMSFFAKRLGLLCIVSVLTLLAACDDETADA